MPSRRAISASSRVFNCAPQSEGRLVGRSPTRESGKVVQARAGVAPRRRTFHRRLACPRPPPLAVQAVTSMNGGGGALALRPTWLRLDEAITILVERGATSELAEALLRRAIASGIRVRPTGGFQPEPFPGALRFRVHGDIRQSVGTKWLAPPNLNFSDSTIALLAPIDTLENTLTWALIEVWADDLDKLWQPFDRRGADSASSKSHDDPGFGGIHEAIAALWPSGIPKGLKAKDRDKRIADWLKQDGRSVPSGSGLARAVQRALKP